MKKLKFFSLFIVLIPAIVYGHVYLRECRPDVDATLTSSPEKVTMIFVGSVEAAFSKIEVFDEKGDKISNKTDFFEDDTVMEVKISPKLKTGEYIVKWAAMGLDGHKQKGSYKFRIK